MRHATLIHHSETPCPAVSGLDVRVSLRSGGELTLTYTLSGDLSGLLIPSTATPTRADGLWRHTCFEAFAMADGGPGYREFNFSPSGDWAAYRFQAYRDGASLDPIPEPAIVRRVHGDRLELEARLPRAALPEGIHIRLGLSAVIEEKDGKLSYWALGHPPGKPDFHHTDAFALELEWI
jgi:hypothetical protein